MSESTRSSDPPNSVTFNASKESALKATKKKSITILLIGGPGSGKTTFGSLLVNLFQGTAPLEMVDINGPSEKSGLAVSNSQTTRATRYIVNTLDGTQVHILDLPGLADKDGVGQDSKHLRDIKDTIEAYKLGEIDALLVLSDGRNERLDVSSEYTLGMFAALLPQKVTPNVCFMLTNCDALGSKFDINTVQEGLRKSNSWFIDNPLAILNDLRKKQSEGEIEPRNYERLVGAVKSAYKGAVDDLNSWYEWLDELKPQDIGAIGQLCETAVQIESKVNTIITNFVDSTERQKLEDAHTKFNHWEGEKDRLEESKRKETEPRWMQDITTQLNTVCDVSECHSNCHKSCMTIDKSQPGRCLVFYKGKCDTCGHPASDHVQDYYVYDRRSLEPKPETVKDLEDATRKEKEYRVLYEDLSRKLGNMDANRSTAFSDMKELLKSFSRLSLSRNFASHIYRTIDLLEARKDRLSKEPNTERDRETIDRILKELRNKLKIIEGDNLPDQ